MNLLKLISYVSSISIILPLLAGLSFFRRLPNTAKILFAYVTITFIIELITGVLFYQKRNNLFMFHFHTYLEFILFSLIYIRLARSTYFKSIAILGMPLFLIFSVYLITRVQGLDHFNSIQRHVEGAILIIYFVFYLVHPKELGKQKWRNLPFAIFSIASLIYFSGSLFVFMLADQMFETGEDSAWVIHGFLNTMLNIVIAYVFWCLARLDKITK